MYVSVCCRTTTGREVEQSAEQGSGAAEAPKSQAPSSESSAFAAAAGFASGPAEEQT